MDSGVENLNEDVDKLLECSALQRIIAQIDVSFSNPLIEAWWRSLKHQWLFLSHLDNLVTLRRLIEFYVVEHNQTIPHHAFNGQTPDEMYIGHGTTVPDELAERRRAARRKRVELKRDTACSNCSQAGAVLRQGVAA